MSELFQSIIKQSSTIAYGFQIPSGQQDSNVLHWKEFLYDAEAITIYSPTTLPETITIQISPDDVVVGSANFYTLLDTNQTAIKLPTAGSAIVYNGIITGAIWIKLHSGSNVGADRNFSVIKSFRGR